MVSHVCSLLVLLAARSTSISTTNEDDFERVYQLRAWGGGNNSSLSGASSSLRETSVLCSMIQTALHKVHAVSLVHCFFGSFGDPNRSQELSIAPIHPK